MQSYAAKNGFVLTKLRSARERSSLTALQTFVYKYSARWDVVCNKKDYTLHQYERQLIDTIWTSAGYRGGSYERDFDS